MKTRFLDLLRAAQEGSRSGVLIASLPRNDPELARAALAGGVIASVKPLFVKTTIAV